MTWNGYRNKFRDYARGRALPGGLYWLICFQLLFCPVLSPADTRQDADLARALAAYERSDYQTAGDVFRKLAEQGQVEAQRYLGQMFDKGLGMAKNYHQAIAWYRKAAEQRDPAAQYYLGLKYANGHGVPENPLQAYIWFAISFNNGFARAANPLRVLNKSLSTRDRQEALKIVVKKMDRYGK